ncbi:retrovirus-related pol polyprotein from transposon TNT 1-94 [Tanacetum coccineum]
MMVANSRKHHRRVRSYTREVLVISTNLDIQKNHYHLDFKNRRGDELRIKNTCTKIPVRSADYISTFKFCDADLEVAFRKSTCFVRDLQGNDLLIGNRGTDLYTISLQETSSSIPICLMAKASPTQAWLWHRRLSHLNFDYINLLSKKDVVIGLPKLKYVKDQLCSSCEVSKAKRSSFKSKTVPSSPSTSQSLFTSGK